MTAYLTLNDLKARSWIPDEWFDDAEARKSGFVEMQLELESAAIDARLAKRYGTPFHAPYPVKVQQWLTWLVSDQIMFLIGVEQTDAMYERVKESYQRAVDELKEAADAEKGLFDLPLRSDTSASGITKPRVKSYSETSPFLGQRLQRERGREEDRNGYGTRR